MKFYTNVARLGNKMLSRGYDENGKQYFKKDENFKPKLYLPSKNSNSIFKSLEGKPLDVFEAGTISDVKDFIDKYKNVDNFEYFGFENWVSNYIVSQYPDKIEYDYSMIRVAFFDIETEIVDHFPNAQIADEEICIISFWFRGKYTIFSTEKFGKYETTIDNVESLTYKTESEMLSAVVDWFEKMSFDVISGWNSEFFDIPYMINRMYKVIGKEKTKKLSPFGLIHDIQVPSLKGDVPSYSIVGVNHIDYLDAFKKFSGVQVENYKLDTVGSLELGLKKLDYSKYGTMKEFQTQNFNEFCDYNIRDNEIMVGIEKKRKIIELITNLAIDSKVNLIDTFKQTIIWDAKYYDHLLKKNVIVPPKKRNVNDKPIPGGFVREVIPGKNDWIVSVDLDSLYPHLILQYNISPETYRGMVDVNVDDLVNKKDLSILQEIKNKNLALAGNGALFTREFRGFIPELMDILYQDRKSIKKEMLKKKTYLEDNRSTLSASEISKLEDSISSLDMFQKVKKITLNSAYGSLAQVGFRFFQYELASAITLSGQVVIQWAVRKFNEYFNKLLKTTDVDYILAADTDSNYIKFKPIVELYKKKNPNATDNEVVDFIIKIMNDKIQPYIDEFYDELAEYMNAYEMKMHMKLENVIKSCITLAKKKYICGVLDSEGVRYDEPHLKVMGLELVKSNTPAFCRKQMKSACKILLEGTQDELLDFIDGTKTEFMKLEFEDIAYPQGVNHIKKYTDKHGGYVSGTQIYARGAIIYNKLIKEKNLTNKFEIIGDGDKIKYCYLKVPNPIQENIISVPFSLPKELGLHKYIDYETQFTKTFMNAVGRMTDAVGWELERKNTLEDFFN